MYFTAMIISKKISKSKGGPREDLFLLCQKKDFTLQKLNLQFCNFYFLSPLGCTKVSYKELLK